MGKLFVEENVHLCGYLKSIVLDQDRVSMSEFWSEIFHFKNTSLKHSYVYHSQKDRQTEVAKRSLETYLHCFISTQPRQ